MVVKDIELTSIEGRKYTKRAEIAIPPRIETNSTVTLITKLSENEADVDFRYMVTYPGCGLIRVEGRFVYEGNAEVLFSQWKAKRNMPNEIASEIHTAIVKVCMPETIIIARSLSLQPPIPLPTIEIKNGKKGEAPSGIEVV
ncbi:MAG: hypothetical protein AB1779_04075 [Candidatus Thermoplasmatota archaeon]